MLLALCVLVDCLKKFFVLLFALATPTHLLIFDTSCILILLLLIDLSCFKMDLLQLEHIKDVKNWVDLLVRAHGDPLLQALSVSL